MTDVAEPPAAAYYVASTALFSGLAYLISHGTATQLQYALELASEALDPSLRILACNLQVTYEHSFRALSTVNLVEGAFMAVSQRVMSDPASKLLALEFVRQSHRHVSSLLIVGALVPNIHWPLSLPLSNVVVYITPFSSLKSAAGSSLAKILYSLASLLYFGGGSLERFGLSQVRQASITSLRRALHIDSLTPPQRESSRSMLWAVAVVYAYHIIANIPADGLQRVERAFTCLLEYVLTGTIQDPDINVEPLPVCAFSVLSKYQEVFDSNQLIHTRAFAMYRIDASEARVVEEINQWQQSPEGKMAETAYLQGQTITIARTKIRRHGSDKGRSHSIQVPEFSLRTFQDNKDSDETYTSDSYSMGAIFSDVDILQKHMGPDFCTTLRVTFYGLLVYLLDDSAASVKLGAVDVCNEVFAHIEGGITSLQGLVADDGDNDIPCILAEAHILKEIMYALGALLADPMVPLSKALSPYSRQAKSISAVELLNDAKISKEACKTLSPQTIARRHLSFMYLDNIFRGLFLQLKYARDLGDEYVPALFGAYLPRTAVFAGPNNFSTLGRFKDFQLQGGSSHEARAVSTDLIRKEIREGVEEIVCILRLLGEEYAAGDPSIKSWCVLSSFILGSRPLLCEILYNPFTSLRNLRHSLSIEANSSGLPDNETIRKFLTDELHGMVIEELQKATICEDVRLGFLWGFLPILGMAPPSTFPSTTSPLLPNRNDLQALAS
ncbi:hypothetical protein GMRT_16213 [Giardia muris]|uniref:Uncharacterized protein n=1 Tax=Giardia muris TaxID=5742 RepID=A0A4Z1SPC2_GIAMU|nr:hypothetical protein GMRT_16213 [Giardia muris]|eukprot:TNJ27672.1 hypothetical protein GMRT_16213 [Giardia muris]